jgi:hypothetical protein
VLAALCACAETAPTQAAMERLRAYEWRVADHAVVFAAIRGCVERGAGVTRENLIALATRAGFPDVEIDAYFQARDDQDLNDAITKLLNA